MNPKQNILQVLFENCVFEGNFSELARTLGYNSESRSTIERVRKGKSELTEKTLDALYDKIKEEYVINDKDILTIADSIAYGKDLYSLLREAYGIGDGWHDIAFRAIVTEDFALMPNFDEELITALKEIKLQEPDVYYGTLSYFYILCKGIFPYTGKGRKELSKQLYGLNDILQDMYPTGNRAYESGKETIKIILSEDNTTILKLIYNLKLIIRWYVDNTYYENFLREMGLLLDVGEDSFWTIPGETFHEGCELWYMTTMLTKSQHHGLYMAMKLKAKSRATDSFELIAAYNIIFIIDEHFNDIPLCYAYEIATGKHEYAQFSYDEESRLLELDYEDESENTFNLPTRLECINHTAPERKDEKIWANIIEKLLKDKCFKYILTALNSSVNNNFEFLVDYDVTNVCIDRKNVTVTYEKEIGREYDEVEKKEKIIVEQKSYAIPINSYSFLKELTPNEFASVVRYKDTGELAIMWNDLGQSIPLKEFVEV